jgi:hypothetical protein
MTPTQFTCVMTLGERIWDVYGKNSVDSFVKYWPEHVQLFIYYDGKFPEYKANNVHFLPFDEAIPEHAEFSQRNKDRHPDFLNYDINNINVQAAKFACKVYAQLKELEKPRSKYVIYLDGDVVTKKEVTEDLLYNMVNKDVYLSFVNRMPSRFTETSIMIWNTQNKYHKEWCKGYRAMYDEDKIFEHKAWHDCIAFDETTFPMIDAEKISCIDLGYGMWKKSKHPLVVGPLGEYFDHLKGPSRKAKGFSPEREHAGF